MPQPADRAPLELRDVLSLRHQRFLVLSRSPALPLTSAFHVDALCIVQLLSIRHRDSLHRPGRTAKDVGGISDRAIRGAVLLALSLQYGASDVQIKGVLSSALAAEWCSAEGARLCSTIFGVFGEELKNS